MTIKIPRLSLTGSLLMPWLVIGLCISSFTIQAKPEPIDAVVAIVNDDIILQSEFDTRYEVVSAQIRAAGNRVPPASILREQVIERLILESIQLQMANRAGIKLSDQELNDTIERIARHNNLSPEAFKNQIEETGTSFEDAREQIRRERIISEVQRYQIGSKIEITETDIDLFLESEQGKTSSAADYRLGHILIQVPQEASPEVIQAKSTEAEALVKRLRQGESFTNAAISESDGQNALKGGDLGWRSEPELPTLFAQVVPNMPEGGISDPIRSPSGFHIIKIHEKRGGVTKIVEQTKVRHILLQSSKIRSDKKTLQAINRVRNDLLKGADFAALAKAESDDPGSAAAGGDLGWVSPGEMVPAFERVMQRTAKGKISNVFKSNFGWHILQVIDRRKADVGKVLQRNQAQELLFKRRFEEELPIWQRQIRSEAFVDIKKRFTP